MSSAKHGTGDWGLGTGIRLVVGLGATGLSVARHLVRAGVPFVVTDSRAAPPNLRELETLSNVPCAFGAFASPVPLDQITEAVVSPGISLSEPFVQELRDVGIPIVGDIELFARLIAITGSNGKSTVTAWVTEIARAAGRVTAIGGNYGPPALDLLADDVELYVLELSSFQLELTQSLASRAATVLNVSPDHIDRHGSLEHYAALKARIFDAAEVAVINIDDPRVASMSTGSARVLRFGTARHADYRLLDDQSALGRGDQPWMNINELRLTGRHNAANALAVWALTEAISIDDNVIRQGLRSFAGLAHRCQTIAEIRGVRWINDSKGTNLGALLASLAGMAAPVILLAGGQAKGADFTELAPVAAEKTRAVIVFGQDGELIARAVADQANVHRVATLTDAVACAHEMAQPGDTVLLSPGCASFDQFDNYMQRGDVFAAAVRELAA
jgi:UDP-N-acetylmuramoylalanine--D-glutamate ligase